MKITMIGSGYVGLVSGACFADFGHDVICVDKNVDKIAQLNAGIMPIFEPGLNELVATNARAGRLLFTTDLAGAMDGSQAIFIAVGTPSRRGDGHADLSYVYAAAREVADNLTAPAVIVTKSTVPVGTGDEVERIVAAARPATRFAVASNPEFLREGAAINDFKRPDRIVIGINSLRAEELMKSLYKPFTLNGHPIIFMDITSAEMTKYAANSMLATKISFMNDIANLCEIVGADINMVRKGIGSDSRIGQKLSASR